jgi:hypothetical protein
VYCNGTKESKNIALFLKKYGKTIKSLKKNADSSSSVAND